MTCSCIAASKTAWRPLPSAFARYMATSASRITCSGCGLRGRERDPDRRADEQLAPVEQERRLQAVQDALGDDRRLARVADVVEQQRELVAAQPRDRVVRAQRRFEPARDGLQQLVAGRVAERVVDDLEAVEVEEQHRGAALGVVALGAADRLVEAVDEQHAVREAGQRVVERVVLQAALGLAAVGDVGDAADDRGSRAARRRGRRSPRASIQR